MSRFAIITMLLVLCITQTVRAQEVRIDSLRGYSVKVPSWLNVVWASDRLFGGDMPEVNSIENTILIAAYAKSDYKSFDEFKDIYITGNVFGQPTKYSKEHTWYGSNREVELPNGGLSRRVFTIWKNKVYHNQFVVLETKAAYLWIQFCATPTTYDINLPKFDEFMAGLVIL